MDKANLITVDECILYISVSCLLTFSHICALQLLEQCECPSTDGKNNDNLEHIHSEILFSSKEKELESIIVSEVTPTQKDECQYSLSSVVLKLQM